MIPLDAGGYNRYGAFYYKDVERYGIKPLYNGRRFPARPCMELYTKRSEQTQVVTDSLRGSNSQLLTSLSNTQYTFNYVLTSFDSDGFSIRCRFGSLD